MPPLHANLKAILYFSIAGGFMKKNCFAAAVLVAGGVSVAVASEPADAFLSAVNDVVLNDVAARPWVTNCFLGSNGLAATLHVTFHKEHQVSVRSDSYTGGDCSGSVAMSISETRSIEKGSDPERFLASGTTEWEFLRDADGFMFRIGGEVIRLVPGESRK